MKEASKGNPTMTQLKEDRKDKLKDLWVSSNDFKRSYGPWPERPAHMVMGSVAEKTVRLARIPVLTVPLSFEPRRERLRLAKRSAIRQATEGCGNKFSR
jgi:hypothetical protein